MRKYIWLVFILAACNSDDTSSGSDASTNGDSDSAVKDSATMDDDSAVAADSGSSDAGPHDAAAESDSATTMDSNVPLDDAGNEVTDSATAMDAAQDASNTVDAGIMYTLTINNYLSWCSVKIDTDPARTNATITKMFDAGTVVQLTGDKASNSFKWGFWTNTAGDTTVNRDQQMMTTVTMDSDKTVVACCPFANDVTPLDACGNI
jgi:hypothetical protein